MFLHIWLGLLSLPLVFGHSGFIYGRLLVDSVTTSAGLLSMAVMTLYLLVIASGVWGLAMQQVIPQKMLERPSRPRRSSAMREHDRQPGSLTKPRPWSPTGNGMRKPMKQPKHGPTAELGSAKNAFIPLVRLFSRGKSAPTCVRASGARAALAASARRSRELFAELRRGAAPSP